MVNFQNGQLLKGAYVIIDGVEYPVVMPEYTGNTPISSENLNKAQKDLQNLLENSITNAKGTQLFYNETGTNGTVSLADIYSDYHYIEIFAGKEEIGITSVKIPIELYNQKINIIQSQYINSSILQIVEKQLKFSGNSLIVSGEPGYINFDKTELKIAEMGSENKIKVFMVVGYKY